MPSSFIPQRIKRAKQQITVKLYQDQLDMLDSYGRFIDDSRDDIISQGLERVFKRDKEFARWLQQQRKVCPEFCVNDQVLFSGMGCWGRGHVPLPQPIL